MQLTPFHALKKQQSWLTNPKKKRKRKWKRCRVNSSVLVFCAVANGVLHGSHTMCGDAGIHCDFRSVSNYPKSPQFECVLCLLASRKANKAASHPLLSHKNTPRVLSHSLTNTNTRTHSLSLTHTRTHTHTLSHSHTHTHAHAPHTLSLTHAPHSLRFSLGAFEPMSQRRRSSGEDADVVVKGRFASVCIDGKSHSKHHAPLSHKQHSPHGGPHDVLGDRKQHATAATSRSTSSSSSSTSSSSSSSPPHDTGAGSSGLGDASTCQLHSNSHTHGDNNNNNNNNSHNNNKNNSHNNRHSHSNIDDSKQQQQQQQQHTRSSACKCPGSSRERANSERLLKRPHQADSAASTHGSTASASDRDGELGIPRRHGDGVVFDTPLVASVSPTWSAKDYERALQPTDLYICKSCGYFIDVVRHRCRKCDNVDLCPGCFEAIYDKHDLKPVCSHDKASYMLLCDGWD